MYIPEKEITDIQYFIKKKGGTMVAGWKGYLGNELHWDYEYVGSIEKGKEVLKKYGWEEGIDVLIRANKKVISLLDGLIDFLDSNS